MSSTPARSSEELLERFESLIGRIKELSAGRDELEDVQYNSLARTHNSSVEDFKSLYPREFEALALEKVSLYDEDQKERVPAEKTSTLLRQSKHIAGTLRLLSETFRPAAEFPERITPWWLWKHVPVKMWAVLIGLILTSFSFGVASNRIEWIQNYIGGGSALSGTVKELRQRIGTLEADKTELITEKTELERDMQQKVGSLNAQIGTLQRERTKLEKDYGALRQERDAVIRAERIEAREDILHELNEFVQQELSDLISVVGDELELEAVQQFRRQWEYKNYMIKGSEYTQ
ncbi:MAG: hypothetical protein SWE60_03240 [Thermodesulfobacteriota bacterium]|nr:hypothetical protein [Thermodesulfobacteriota bacterium]